MQTANGQGARRQLRPVLPAGPSRWLLRWLFGAAGVSAPRVRSPWPFPLRPRHPACELRALQQVQLAAVLRPPRLGRVRRFASLVPRLLWLLTGPRELPVLHCWCPELAESSLHSLRRVLSVRDLFARSRPARQLSAGNPTWAIWPRRSAAAASGACDVSASPQVTTGCGCEVGALR